MHPLRYYPGKQYQNEWLDFPGNNLSRELIFDAFAGPSFNALSVLSDEPANRDTHQLWFNLLNRGFFVPVLSDSDACFDRPTFGFHAPGFWTTWFYIGSEEAITSEKLVDALREGRTFASTGPLVQFRIGKALSGATLKPDNRSRTASITVDYPQHAFSLAAQDDKTNAPHQIARIELLRNGAVVQTWEQLGDHIQLEHPIIEAQACWYAVRVIGTDQQWQVALTSPIYFADQQMPRKREPLTANVRGRIYDFKSGAETSAKVEIRRGGQLLKQFDADGQFRVAMPIDAEIIVHAEGKRPIRKNLLMDYGPVHRFLWNLESRDMGRAETLERFELMMRAVDLEFPIGYQMPGSYIVPDAPTHWNSVQINGGPERVDAGSVSVAAVVLDTEQVAAGDSLKVTAIFRDEGGAADVGPYVVEARGYNPARPTAYGALKKFDSFEKNWSSTGDLGDGYRSIAGTVVVPTWVEAGPTSGIDLSIRVRQGHGDAAFIGMSIPLGPTQRAISVTSSWPTMPISWPDQSYGIGPFKVCNRIGRKGQPKSDYRRLQLSLITDRGTLGLWPERDGRACADADDAMYAGHYFDQVLAEQTGLAQADLIRPQPSINWRDLPIINVTP